MKNYLILGLCLIIGVLVAYLFRPAPDQPVTGDLTVDQENELRANLVEAEGYADSLYRELKQSKAFGIESATAFKKEIGGHRKEIARLKANPVVIQFVQENPILDSLHHAYDSAITSYENRVVSLTNELQLRDKINAQLQSNFEARLSAAESLLVDKEAEVTQLQGENKKLRRRMFWGKVGGIAILGGVIALTL